LAKITSSLKILTEIVAYMFGSMHWRLGHYHLVRILVKS